MSVSKWRIFCNTEQSWVESWGTVPPTVCANNNTHEINPNSVQELETISNQVLDIGNLYQDSLESLRIVEQTSIIDLKSFYGLNKHSIYGVSGNATISALSEITPEIKLSITGSNDVCTIRSSERGYYTAGFVSECGIALRIPLELDTTQQIRFGYFDTNNGYYFKLTGNLLSVCTMNNGIEVEVSRDNFNKNKLDGTETNGITLDFAKGNIFRINFTWYGFGNITFSVIQTDNANKQKVFELHTFDTYGTTSCGNPNLPINVVFSSNGSIIQRNIFIGGRQYSILGKTTRNMRSNMYFINNITGIYNVVAPLFTMRNKSTHKTCTAIPSRLRGISSTNVRLTMVENATLNSTNFINNPYVDETCMVISTSATTITGYAHKSYLLLANIPFDIDILDIAVYEDSTMTFAWQPIINNITGNVLSIQIDWDEQW